MARVIALPPLLWSRSASTSSSPHPVTTCGEASEHPSLIATVIAPFLHTFSSLRKLPDLYYPIMYLFPILDPFYPYFSQYSRHWQFLVYLNYRSGASYQVLDDQKKFQLALFPLWLSELHTYVGSFLIPSPQNCENLLFFLVFWNFLGKGGMKYSGLESYNETIFSNSFAHTQASCSTSSTSIQPLLSRGFV